MNEQTTDDDMRQSI